jgi:predicted Zn-dependent peptidase
MINFQIKTLKNGIRLITAPLESTEATTIQILVGSGGRFDPLAKSGISHFLEHMFFKGSKKYPSFAEVTKAFDGIGAGYNASTSYEAIRFHVQACSKDFRKGYEVLQDIFTNPVFNEDYIELERGVILEEIKMYKDMPQAWVGILNQAQTFPDHPLGADLGGDEETVSKITKEDLISNWKEHYSPETMIIALSGNLKDQSIIKQVEEDFETIPHIPIKKFEEFDQNKFKPSLKQEVRTIDQANFVISYPSIGKRDERRYAQTIMDIILGASPSSRLYSEIREKRGLAYDVGSGANSYFDTGAYYIYGGVKQDKMEEVYKLILDEIDKIKTKGVTEEELNLAKGNFRGTITRSLEGSYQIANYLTGSLYWQGEIIDLEDLIKRHEKVTNQEIIDLARETFQEGKEIVSIVAPKEYKL